LASVRRSSCKRPFESGSAKFITSPPVLLNVVSSVLLSAAAVASGIQAAIQISNVFI
jgi:hypothetical protein